MPLRMQEPKRIRSRDAERRITSSLQPGLRVAERFGSPRDIARRIGCRGETERMRSIPSIPPGAGSIFRERWTPAQSTRLTPGQTATANNPSPLARSFARAKSNLFRWRLYDLSKEILRGELVAARRFHQKIQNLSPLPAFVYQIFEDILEFPETQGPFYLLRRHPRVGPLRHRLILPVNRSTL